MKNKKGFTLIELLAVIVVLAIIALIATPIVMNTIKNAKKGAAERTADNYIKQVETAVATERLNGNILEDGEYQITSDGNLCRDKSASCSDENKIYVEMSGTKPTSGIVTISNGEISKSGTSMIIGDYNVIYNDNKYIATKLETYKITYNLTNVSGNNVTSITSVETKSLTFTANTGYQLPESVTVTGATSVWNKKTGTLIISKVTGDVTVTIVGEEIQPYKNGEVVYFNVDNGTKCTSSDYTETQSNVGVKEGCMKFYAFNDDGGDTLNLILDHNTTALVAWVSKADYIAAGGEDLSNDDDCQNYGYCSKNKFGPVTLLKKLKSDTASWQGTIIPSNYTMDQSTQGSKAKYTIEYSSYKARLITAQEIAQITENTSWNEKTASNWYYFDSKTTTASTTCKSGNTTGCGYGWLYDRTSTDCTTNGCLNNSNVYTDGYWTASSRAAGSRYAWRMVPSPHVFDSSVGGGFGVRPVITILKSKLS